MEPKGRGAPPSRNTFGESVTYSFVAESPSTPNDLDAENLPIHQEPTASPSNIGLLGRQLTVESDEDAMLPDDNVSAAKFISDYESKTTTPLRTSQAAPDIGKASTPESEEIEIRHGPYALPLDRDINAKGKLKNKYVLQDGTVINGKGLGRGRPGFKRGPRKSALSNEIKEETESTSVTLSTASPVSEPRSVSGKRKRAVSDATDMMDDDFELDDASRDSTPEYNPAASTHTRSGRQTQKPVPVVAPSSTTASPATKRPALTQSISSPSIRRHPKIKAKVYRGREQFALCEHCLRGNGPPGNVIVFCDACNKCWHQRCHEPSISKNVVADTKAEWFCVDCDRILHGKKRGRPAKAASQIPQALQIPIAPTPIVAQVSRPEPPKVKYGLPLIPGMSLSPAQRKEYLNSLTKERLIEIVLHSANLAPNMPIFETPYHLIQQPPSMPTPPPTMQSLTPPPVQALSPQSLPPQAMPPPPPPPNPADFHAALSKLARPQLPPQAQPPAPVQPIPEAHSPSQPPPEQKTMKPIPIYDHPTAGVASKPNTQPPPPNLGPEDEGYYDDFDEMALLYPKPGEGVYDLMLRPESYDLGILLEGSECRTFSHWVRGKGEMKRTVEPAR